MSAEKEEEETVPISQSDDIHDIIKERGGSDRAINSLNNG